MFDLSNPQLKPTYISYCKQLGAAEEVILKGLLAIEKALSAVSHLTKEQLGEVLKAEKITDDQRVLSLTLYRAEMEGILCNGPVQGSKQTFTLFCDWTPARTENLCREEALERLARRFFTSHGPATLYDFAWWSGLSVTDCKKAVGLIKDDFVCERANGREFWLKNDVKIPSEDSVSALLLSPFDEYVVSYKDRSEIVHDDHYAKVMTKNGLFSPTVMLNGEIVGSWKKVTGKPIPKIELSFFKKTPKKTERLFDSEIKRLEKFYSKA